MVHVGKILPNQKVKVHVVIIEKGEMFNSAYVFNLNPSLYPRYEEHIVGSSDTPKYTF
jgi:hypothetical protein